MLKKLAIASISSFILAACDGGSSSQKTSQSKNNVKTGVFWNNQIKGLHYQTATQEGLTNELGEFNYIEGELVEFSIGGIYLGTAVSAAALSPFSLSGTQPIDRESKILSALHSKDITSLDRIFNIATLLHSLDTDMTTENGIDLSNANELLKDTTLNLQVKATDFPKSNDLKEILSRMNLSSQPTFSQSAQYLYSSLDLKIKTERVSIIVSSENNIDLSLVKHTYDDKQLLSKKETDLDNDGTYDSYISYRYDVNQRLIETYDSSTDTTKTLSYDDADNVVAEQIDKPGDERDIELIFTYENTKLRSLETDLGMDGMIDNVSHYRYDSMGNLLQQSTEHTMQPGKHYEKNYIYDNELVKTIAEDLNGDGEADSEISYSYDIHGNIISQRMARIENDVLVRTSSKLDYDKDNHPIRYELDNNEDGKPEYIEAYKYNDQGKRIEYKKDLNGDGNWDFATEYLYDDNGNRIQIVEDSDGNGIADRVWQASYQPTVLTNAWSKIVDQL